MINTCSVSIPSEAGLFKFWHFFLCSIPVECTWYSCDNHAFTFISCTALRISEAVRTSLHTRQQNVHLHPALGSWCCIHHRKCRPPVAGLVVVRPVGLISVPGETASGLPTQMQQHLLHSKTRFCSYIHAGCWYSWYKTRQITSPIHPIILLVDHMIASNRVVLP